MSSATVSVEEAHEHWELLVERAEAGEEITVERDGVGIAKIVPIDYVSARSDKSDGA